MRRIALPLAALAAIALLATGCEDEFANRCDERGGVVDKSTKTGTGTGVSASGKPVIVTTTTTTRYCLVDGRIAEVD